MLQALESRQLQQQLARLRSLAWRRPKQVLPPGVELWEEAYPGKTMPTPPRSGLEPRLAPATSWPESGFGTLRTQTGIQRSMVLPADGPSRPQPVRRCSV